MGIGSVGGSGFTPYSTAMNSGPTAALQTGEAESSKKAQEEQRLNSERQEPASAANTTPTRGQNLNITV
jgi:hypothetical protein